MKYFQISLHLFYFNLYQNVFSFLCVLQELQGVHIVERYSAVPSKFLHPL